MFFIDLAFFVLLKTFTKLIYLATTESGRVHFIFFQSFMKMFFYLLPKFFIMSKLSLKIIFASGFHHMRSKNSIPVKLYLSEP